MKRVLIYILLILIVVLSPASMVSAGTSDNVLVTAVGWIAGVPGGFTLTYISDYEIGISWDKGLGADNTMIRAKYGSYPTDINDGYLVYYGSAANTSDTAVSMDETAVNVFYRAWSEKDGIFVESGYAEGNIGGIWMTLIAFIIIALVPTIAAWVLKRTLFAVMGIGGWLFVGVYAYQLVDTQGTLYYGLFMFAMGMMMMCVVEIMHSRGKRSDDQPFFEGDFDPEEDEELTAHRVQRRIRKQKRAQRTGGTMSAERQTQIKMRADGKRVIRKNQRILNSQSAKG